MHVEPTAGNDEQRARGSVLNMQQAREAWAADLAGDTKMQLQDLSFRSAVLSASPAWAIDADEAVLKSFLKLLT